MQKIKTFATLTALIVTALSARAQLTPTNPPASVVLAWTPPSGSIAGYRLYYGTASRSYTNTVSVSATNTTITPLVRGVTYYFAVTATDTNGLESVFSNEITYTPPTGPAAPTLRLAINGAGKLIIGKAYPYASYVVQRSRDLRTWNKIGQASADRAGVVNFLDSNPPKLAAFYRLKSA